MPEIHRFRYRAMATHFEVRIADQESAYAAQAAQAALTLLDPLEAHLSRFRADSDIARIAQLSPGEQLKLNEPAFACLDLAKRMESATLGGFSTTAAALQTETSPPQWGLLPTEHSILCESGRIQLDLGAIGKGFALDCMAELLRIWDCPAFLLVAGGSSILAGDSPEDTDGWSCGLGDNNSPERLLLKHCSLSGSGLAVKGDHILDPRTGGPVLRQDRAWAVADTAAESDALSTACMVLNESEIEGVLAQNATWVVFLEPDGILRPLGRRPFQRDTSNPST